MDLVYKAEMLSQGGRNGTIQSDDGSVRIKLAVPASMGGKGDGPQPPVDLLTGALGGAAGLQLAHAALAQGYAPLREQIMRKLAEIESQQRGGQGGGRSAGLRLTNSVL